ncbi:hypothetical protein ABPG72_022741 [Tetrahymena utriculariae]
MMKFTEIQDQQFSGNKFLSEEQKWGVIIGFKYFNQNYDQLMEMFLIKSKGTITKLLQKYSQQSNVENNHHFSGQNGLDKQVLEEQINSLVQNENYKVKFSVNDVQLSLAAEDTTISRSSTYNIMKDLNFKYGRALIQHALTEQNKIKRIKHCRLYSYQDLSQILFTDETIISLRDNKVQIWYRQDFEKQIQKSDTNWNNSFIHVWGGISLQGKTELYIYDDNVNSEQYQICLQKTFLPFKLEHPRIILLQDGAKCHTSKSTMSFFNEQQIQYIQNPPYSPDLNCIEMACIKNLARGYYT